MDQDRLSNFSDVAATLNANLGPALSRGFAETVGASSISRTPQAAAARWWSDYPPRLDHTPTIVDADLDEDVVVPGPAEERSGVRILVNDDDPSLLRTLTISLGSRGNGVAGARTGEEGLNKVAHWHPDLVPVDFGLPGIDGVEVVRGLRG